jgi:hypothetical protein
MPPPRTVEMEMHDDVVLAGQADRLPVAPVGAVAGTAHWYVEQRQRDTDALVAAGGTAAGAYSKRLMEVYDAARERELRREERRRRKEEKSRERAALADSLSKRRVRVKAHRGDDGDGVVVRSSPVPDDADGHSRSPNGRVARANEAAAVARGGDGGDGGGGGDDGGDDGKGKTPRSKSRSRKSPAAAAAAAAAASAKSRRYPNVIMAQGDRPFTASYVAGQESPLRRGDGVVLLPPRGAASPDGDVAGDAAGDARVLETPMELAGTQQSRPLTVSRDSRRHVPPLTTVDSSIIM